MWHVPTIKEHEKSITCFYFVVFFRNSWKFHRKSKSILTCICWFRGFSFWFSHFESSLIHFFLFTLCFSLSLSNSSTGCHKDYPFIEWILFSSEILQSNSNKTSNYLSSFSSVVSFFKCYGTSVFIATTNWNSILLCLAMLLVLLHVIISSRLCINCNCNEQSTCARLPFADFKNIHFYWFPLFFVLLS